MLPMAIRILSKSFLRRSAAAPSGVLSPSLRHRSSQPGNLIEIDIESSPSTCPSKDGDGEIEIIKMRKLEEAIQALFVEKATPDWLPFIPGSSFWVPPRKPKADVVDIVDRLWSPLRDEEEFRFAGGHGWPAIEFFSSKDGVPETLMELELEVEVKATKEDGAIISESEDRE